MKQAATLACTWEAAGLVCCRAEPSAPWGQAAVRLARAGHPCAGVGRSQAPVPALPPLPVWPSAHTDAGSAAGFLEQEACEGDCGKAAPCHSVVLSPSNMKGPSGERGAGQLWRRGRGCSEGLGTVPSPDQVAVACWPEIPSSVTEQVLGPLSLALLGVQVPSFQEAQGMPFLQRLTRNLACPFCPRGAGGWCARAS